MAGSTAFIRRHPCTCPGCACWVFKSVCGALALSRHTWQRCSSCDTRRSSGKKGQPEPDLVIDRSVLPPYPKERDEDFVPIATTNLPRGQVMATVREWRMPIITSNTEVG